MDEGRQLGQQFRAERHRQAAADRHGHDQGIALRELDGAEHLDPARHDHREHHQAGAAQHRLRNRHHQRAQHREQPRQQQHDAGQRDHMAAGHAGQRNHADVLRKGGQRRARHQCRKGRAKAIAQDAARQAFTGNRPLRGRAQCHERARGFDDGHQESDRHGDDAGDWERHPEVQRLRHRDDRRLVKLGEVDQAQRQAEQVAAGNADHNGRGRQHALAPLHHRDHQRQHRDGNRQVAGCAIAAAALAACGPVDGHRNQRQADHGDYHAGDGMRKQLADRRHEEAAQDHHQRTRQRRAQDASYAVFDAHADGRADKGEAGAHHAWHADAHRANALALDDGDDARAKQGRIHQGDDLVRRQLQRTANDQRHRNDAAQGGQQMLERKQKRRQPRGAVFHFE
ncbi:hypothetical protein D3C72_1284160 [compost metagenome]